MKNYWSSKYFVVHSEGARIARTGCEEGRSEEGRSEEGWRTKSRCSDTKCKHRLNGFVTFGVCSGTSRVGCCWGIPKKWVEITSWLESISRHRVSTNQGWHPSCSKSNLIMIQYLLIRLKHFASTPKRRLTWLLINWLLLRPKLTLWDSRCSIVLLHCWIFLHCFHLFGCSRLLLVF